MRNRFALTWGDNVQRTLFLCRIIEFCWAVYFGAAVITVVYQHMGLSLAQIILLPVGMNLVNALVEIPLGHLADRFGIKRALIAGGVLQIVQACLLAFWARSFWPCIVVVTLNAISWSVINGTTSALVGNDRAFQTYRTRAQLAGRVFGSVLGGLLAAYVTTFAPIQIQPVTFVFSLLAACLLPSSTNGRLRSKRTAGRIRAVLHTLFVRRADVRWLLLLDAVLYATMLAAGWLAQPDMQAAHVPLAWFTAIFLLQPLLSYVLTFLRVTNDTRRGAVLQGMVVISTACIATAAVPHTNFVGAAVIYLAIAFHGAYANQLIAGTINEIPEVQHQLTTAHSVNSALRALLFVPAFLLGKLADGLTTDVALLCLALAVAIGGGTLLHLHTRSTMIHAAREYALAQ